jgi:hypothetical protein
MDTANRPTGVRIFGVLSLLFALLGSLLAGCSQLASSTTVAYGGLQVVYAEVEGKPVVHLRVFDVVRDRRGRRGLALVRRARGGQLSTKGREALEDLRSYTQLLSIGMGLLSLLLLVVAIGQLGYRGWGRTLSVIWASLTLLLIAFIIFHAISEMHLHAREVTFAVLKNFRRAEAICPALPLSKRALFALIAMAYPLLTLLYFNGPKARAAMED